MKADEAIMDNASKTEPVSEKPFMRNRKTPLNHHLGSYIMQINTGELVSQAERKCPNFDPIT